MVLELGPCPAREAGDWTKFARRIMVELRSESKVMRNVSPDLVSLWSDYIEQWSAVAGRATADGVPFRWSDTIEPEVGEFLLHGLDQCLHSPFMKNAATPAETEAHMGFTMSVVRAFVESLAAEGKSCSHYVDQVLTSFGAELDD
jgi:hypothetical protein